MSFAPRRGLLIALVVAGWVLTGPGAAWAGCGCDHPPPGWAPVMPPFASPGKTVRIHPDGFEFVPGSFYGVEFGSHRWALGVAEDGYLDVKVPSGVQPGPVAIRVLGIGLNHTYGSEHFTALSPAPVVPAGDGVFGVPQFEASVSADGTLLVPFNLSQVLDPTQFGFVIGGLALTFGHDDVVFYNEDGVDLTLFTLDVDDATEREWGSYYGWNVEDDTGLRGDVYDNKVTSSASLANLSDMLTYWRHEFHTYHQAHLPGATHELDAEGYHKNLGTRHVDHDHLILAISGKERSPSNPLDPAQHTDLSPGSRSVALFAGAMVSEHPVEPEDMESALNQAMQAGLTVNMSPEQPSAYDDDDDSDDN